ncbi:MAG: HAD family hydrolase [Pseudomonadota bacterium]
MDETRRIAMWSGPRNLSTAMMRSFGARSDAAVWDEPFYAAYLHATGLDHPMREAVIAAGETDPRSVVMRCLGPAPGDKPIWYQKHMTHHMLPEIERDWLAEVTNVFLIRAPERVAASYAAKHELADLRDIGFVEQKELFDLVADRLGAAPPVIDAADIRADPERALRALCAAVRVPFDPAMLAWPSGPRPEDGVWASHWYEAVNRSTGFAPPEAAPPTLHGDAARLADAARPYYEALRPFAL